MVLGDTPFDGAPIPAGDLRLRVQAPACATLCLPLTAQPGEAVARSLRLVPAKDVPPGMAVVVPAGGFASAPNSPAKPFLIDRREVTNDEFKRFCDATGARTPRHWKRRRIPEGKEGHPVVNVAASDAEAYAAWAGKRLPTAAEWRAAAQGADGRRYPWGNAFDPARLNSRSHGVGGSLPPGRLAAGESPYGVLDLAGNVAEWISCAPLKDAAVRLVAGGHYDSPPEDCTTSSFKSHQAEKPEMWIGFRCARDVP
jgi:serine/threonine-protein kinase